MGNVSLTLGDVRETRDVIARDRLPVDTASIMKGYEGVSLTR